MRVKKSNQKNGLPDGANSAIRSFRDFFDSPSMARSKNAAHPWAAPFGSGCNTVASVFMEELKSNRNRNRNYNRHSSRHRNLSLHIA